MKTLDELFNNNRAWSERLRRHDPEFFPGCRVSRRPPTCGSGAPTAASRPTRSSACCPASSSSIAISPMWWSTRDLNCLSVMQFAVDLLKVRHIIVCGHYGCSGVYAALQQARVGLADNWLRHVQDVTHKHDTARTRAEEGRARRIGCASSTSSSRCANVCQTTHRAGCLGARPGAAVHGWIYGIADGLARDLGTTISDFPDAAPVCGGPRRGCPERARASSVSRPRAHRLRGSACARAESPTARSRARQRGT